MVIFGAGGAAGAIQRESGSRRGRSHYHRQPFDRAGRGINQTSAGQSSPATPTLLPGSAFAIPEETDIVINATSIGLFPDVDARLDFDLNTLTSNMVVADVIPNPPATNLVRDAQERVQSDRWSEHAG